MSMLKMDLERENKSTNSSRIMNKLIERIIVKKLV